MRKQSKPFRFTFQHGKKVVKDLRIVTEYVDLEVSGVGYLNPGFSTLEMDERFSVDIDQVIYHGTDIKEIVEHYGQMDEIETAACKHIANNVFNQSMEAA